MDRHEDSILLDELSDEAKAIIESKAYLDTICEFIKKIAELR